MDARPALLAEIGRLNAEVERLRKSRSDLFEHEQEKWHCIAQAQADALDEARGEIERLRALVADELTAEAQRLGLEY